MFHAVFEPGDKRGFVVSFPDVPEAITEGNTVDEACVTASGMAPGPLPTK